MVNRSFRPLITYFTVSTLVLAILSIPSPGSVTTAQEAPVVIQAARRGNPHVNFKDGRAIPATYSGTAAATAAVAAAGTKGLALASADFDEDGMPDVVASYESGGGGLISLHFGNVDAVYPNAPEAKKRRATGTLVDAPFLPDAKVFETPERPDFIGAGDFDADGHWDVVAARKGGSSLTLHRGDGAGGFHPSETLPLPGSVTALATGDVNRRDGLEDVLVGVVTSEGPRLLVFEWPEGALRGKPEEIALPDDTTEILTGRFDEDSWADVAVAAGKNLVLVRGRDRRLTMPDDIRARAGDAKAEVRTFPQSIVAATLVDHEADGKPELALLASGGGLSLVDPREAATGDDELPEPIARLGLGQVAGARLIPALSSGEKGADVLVMSPSDRSLLYLGISSGQTIRLDTVESLAQGLPLRLNPDALTDFVFLSGSPAGLSSLETSPLAIFTVTNTANSGAGSLRQAIVNANATPGGGTIAFNIPGTGPHTIQPLTPLPSITAPVMIDGTSEPDFVTTPVIVLNGSLAGTTSPALRVLSSGCSIRGLVVNRFSRGGASSTEPAGIRLEGDNNKVEGNFIGTDFTGMSTQANVGAGISAYGSSGNVIGGTLVAARNVVSGNDTAISIGYGTPYLGGTGNVVTGNLVGTGFDGLTILGNSVGIEIRNGTDSRIGGTTAGSGNTVCSTSHEGVLAYQSSGILIQGNLIGVALDGLTPCGNGPGIGVLNDVPGAMTIGGTTPAARNVSSNNNTGVTVAGDCDGILTQGNYLGLNAAGAATDGSLAGVLVYSSADCVVGGAIPAARNIISGNQWDGVTLNSTATGILVIGNYIGTDPSGGSPIPNLLRGVNVDGAPGNQIGGTLPGEGNLISGNGIGVWTHGTGATGNLVGMNKIGTDASGTIDLGNTTGVLIESASNVVRGNVISGNETGVEINGSGATGNTVAGNLIGTDATGSAALLNDLSVLVQDASGNTIGGPSAADRNVITSQGNSLLFFRSTGITANNIAEGNYIGTDASGTVPLGGSSSSNVGVSAVGSTIRNNVIGGNFARGLRIASGSNSIVQGNLIGVGATLGPIGALGPGIVVEVASSDNLIGGTAPGAGNTIANNTDDGIRVGGTAMRTRILGNSIHSNGGLGIDLLPDGVTPNDPGGDADTGPNALQNFPVLTAALTTGGSVSIDGTLSSTPSTTFALDFYASPACDPSGNGEGATFLGSTVVVTAGTGIGAFSVVVPGSVPAGGVVTATATDPSGNTSEFSACASAAGVPPPAPTAVEFPSPVTLSWEAVPGATLYHLYAGTDVTLPRLHTSAYDVCEGGTISTPGVVDFPLVVAPPPGHMLWVVVTSEGVYGEGPPQTGSSGPFDFSSAGSCEGGCAHSVCATGGALEPACTLCASLVCQSDPACCSTTWSASCVQKVRTVCRSLACPESQGTCAHALCDGGTMLVSGCDAPPLSPSCTKAICQVDPHCCNQTWDDACIEKVAMVCRYNCL